MRAIILAAGEGKRLRPLTEKIPKGMVKLFGKSILERQIDIFRKCNINDISIVTGYSSESFNFSRVKYYKNPNYDKTNMVETLFCAQDELKDSVIISYGDIIFQQSVLEQLIKSEDDFSIIVDTEWEEYWKMRFVDPLEDAESLKFNEDNFLQSIGQKAESIEEIQAQYIGLMKFQGEGVKQMIKFYFEMKEKANKGSNPLNKNLKFEQSYMTDFLQGLIDYGYRLRAIPIKHGWLELDSIKDYELYTSMKESNIINHLIELE